jgi:hypothetical protein
MSVAHLGTPAFRRLLVGLALWSFLMATSHGAGLMLVPVILPLRIGQSPASDLIAAGSLSISLAAVGGHTVARNSAQELDKPRLALDRRSHRSRYAAASSGNIGVRHDG